MQDKFKPDQSYFNFAKAEYSRKIHGYPNGQILQSTQEKMLCAAYGVTAWLFTKNGAKWVFSLFDVEEGDPHYAFVYHYVVDGEGKPLDKNGALRVFYKYTHEKVGIPKEAIDTAKKVVIAEGWPVPENEVFEFILDKYRTWIRITQGKSWAASNFTAIRYLQGSNGVAYRFETKEGQVYWFDTKQIAAEPQTVRACDCCEYEFPCCDNYTGMGNLCNRCYAEHFAEPEVLKACNRHECENYQCHNYLNDRQLNRVFEEVGQMPIQWSVNG